MHTDAPRPGGELLEQLLLHWRVRCVLRRAPLEATAGPDAVDLGHAVAGHLLPAWLSPPPALDRALRRWAAGVATPEAARAALTCLAEVVTEAAIDVLGEFPTARLGPVLEEIATLADDLASRQAAHPEAAVLSPAPAWRDRSALERDVEMAAALGAVGRRETALVVVQVDRPRARSLRGLHRGGDGGEDPVTGVAGILRLLVGVDALYRLGRDKVAVLVPGTDSRGVGALMLRVTCAAPRTRLSWGATALGPAGGHTTADGDALVMLAEADLVLRRRDHAHARRALAQHRQRVGASVAAALLLVTGVVVGSASLSPAPSGSPTGALPVGGSHAAPSVVPGSGTAAQAPVAPDAAPPAPTTPGPSTPSAGLSASAPVQAQTVVAVLPLPASPSQTPPIPPPPSTTTPPPTKPHGGGKPAGPPGKPAPGAAPAHGLKV